MEPIKKQFLELLDKDLEFRYAVAGYLGLSEILKRLDNLSEEQVKLREEQISLRKEQTKIWEEIRGLRDGQSKLMEEHAKIWQEIRGLREEQTKIWKEIAGIKAEQISLREEQTKIWREIRGLREEQISLREEQTKLREDFNKMLKVVEELQRGHRRLEGKLDSLRNAMISGLGEVSKFAGLTFEEFVRRFLTAQLKSSGELAEDAELKKVIINGEEINIFSEEPLIVGEVTAHAETADEIRKLLKKAERIKAKYNREPRRLLVVLTAPSDVAAEMRRIADENNVELIIGKTA